MLNFLKLLEYNYLDAENCKLFCLKLERREKTLRTKSLLAIEIINKPTEGNHYMTLLCLCVPYPPHPRAPTTTADKVAHHTGQTTTSLYIAVTFLQAQDQRQESTNSRSILVTAVENQEGVRLSKKILLVQFVGAQLHGCNVLKEKTVIFLPSLRSKSI